MSAHLRSPRWLPALAVVTVCIAALGAATFGGHENAPANATRPAADAPVNVVHAPACATCAMGAGRSMP